MVERVHTFGAEVHEDGVGEFALCDDSGVDAERPRALMNERIGEINEDNPANGPGEERTLCTDKLARQR